MKVQNRIRAALPMLLPAKDFMIAVRRPGTLAAYCGDHLTYLVSTGGDHQNTVHKLCPRDRQQQHTVTAIC